MTSLDAIRKAAKDMEESIKSNSNSIENQQESGGFQSNRVPHGLQTHFQQLSHPTRYDISETLFDQESYVRVIRRS